MGKKNKPKTQGMDYKDPNQTKKKGNKQTPPSQRKYGVGNELFKNAAQQITRNVANDVYRNAKSVAGKAIVRYLPGFAWKAIKLGFNGKQWYTKFGDIQPAANLGRPMNPVFNLNITDNGTMGVPSFVDVEVDWLGNANSTATDERVIMAMKEVRNNLKSNLPYSDAYIKSAIINACTLYVRLKQVERDVTWYASKFSTPLHFKEMYRLGVPAASGYGFTSLGVDPLMSDANWVDTMNRYSELMMMANSSLLIPANFKAFADFYFGNVFMSDNDYASNQLIRINMNNMDWFSTPDGIATDISLRNETVTDLIERINTYNKQFAIVYADMLKANLGVKPGLSELVVTSEPVAAYSKDVLQMLVNAYTSDTVVNDNGFIRLDQMHDATDDLTQYIFLGKAQEHASGLNVGNLIQVRAMVIKFDSNGDITWPSSLTEYASGDGVDFTQPFGIVLSTDIESTTYINTILGTESISAGDIVGSTEYGETTALPEDVETYIAPALTARTGMNVSGMLRVSAATPVGIDVESIGGVRTPYAIYGYDGNGYDTYDIWLLFAATGSIIDNASNKKYFSLKGGSKQRVGYAFLKRKAGVNYAAELNQSSVFGSDGAVNAAGAIFGTKQWCINHMTMGHCRLVYMNTQPTMSGKVTDSLFSTGTRMSDLYDVENSKYCFLDEVGSGSYRIGAGKAQGVAKQAFRIDYDYESNTDEDDLSTDGWMVKDAFNQNYYMPRLNLQLFNLNSTMLDLSQTLTDAHDTVNEYDSIKVDLAPQSWTGNHKLISGADIRSTDLGIPNTYFVSTESTTGSTATATSSITDYSALVAFVADVIDYHLPIFLARKVVHRVTSGIAYSDTVTKSDPVLVKENYMPYFYNIKDLDVIAFRAMSSLIDML